MDGVRLDSFAEASEVGEVSDGEAKLFLNGFEFFEQVVEQFLLLLVLPEPAELVAQVRDDVRVHAAHARPLDELVHLRKSERGSRVESSGGVEWKLSLEERSGVSE